MPSSIFSDDTTEELLLYKSKLKRILINGTRQTTFKDQTVIFNSIAEIKSALQLIIDELDSRDSSVAKRKKIVRIQTKCRGF